MGKSVLKSSKTDVVRSHGHLSNAFCDTVHGPTCRVGLAPQTRGVGADGKALRRFSFGCISRSLLSTSGNITQTQNTLLFSKAIKSRKPTNILCTEKLTLRRSPEEGGHLSGLSLQLFFNQ